MKTYYYTYTHKGKLYDMNIKAKDLKEALHLAVITGYELKGEKVGEANNTDNIIKWNKDV